MKTIQWSIVVILCLAASSLIAQLQINPQLGVGFTDLNTEPRDVFGVELDTEGKAGIVAGVDLRIGGKFYVQPGLFVMGSKTVYRFDDGVIFDQSEITRYGAKLKGLLGLKLIDSIFKLRVMGGPTYDFELGLRSENNPYFDEDEFRAGIFGLDVGVGVDVLFLTAELGYNWALSKTFDDGLFTNEPRYETIYFTVGMVIGN